MARRLNEVGQEYTEQDSPAELAKSLCLYACTYRDTRYLQKEEGRETPLRFSVTDLLPSLALRRLH